MVCKVCAQDLPATTEFFYRDRATLRLTCKRCTLESQKASYDADPTARLAHSRRWRNENRDRAIAASSRAYYENREERLAKEKARYHSDPEVRAKKIENAKRWTSANAAKSREIKRRSQLSHPDTKRHNKMARRARERNALVERVEASKVLKSFGHRCFYCAKRLGKGFHIDHKTPLSRGGLHCYANVVPSCPSCNVRKSSKTAEAFLAALGRLPLS